MIPLGRILGTLRGLLERRLLGVSAEEIRYTISDVRAEIRATRSELLGEIAKLRAEIEQLARAARPPFETGPEDRAAEDPGSDLPQ